jgi:SRSO17 transposase
MTRCEPPLPVDRRVIGDWLAGLDAVHARIAGHFPRAEVRTRVRHYLAGLLSRVERKNGWQLAEHLGEAGPQGVQRLLNGSRWDADAVREVLRDYVIESLGAPDGILTVDESGFLKKGTKSVGVKRQYSGTAGRRENCQIGVFLGYSSTHGHAFLDRALYLPQEWADDAARRTEAGVPESVQFATKPELARQLLERAFAAGVPAGWVTGDTVYGDDPALARWLEEGGRAYVLGVSANHCLWHEGIQQRVDAIVAALPPTAWTTLSAGTGTTGERLFDWTCWRLTIPCRAGMGCWLLARRSLADPRDLDYYRAYGPAETGLPELVRVAGARWTIETTIEAAKGRVGLDEYEVRTWTAWHRHLTLALLAHAYLEVTRVQQTRQEAEKGGPVRWSP